MKAGHREGVAAAAQEGDVGRVGEQKRRSPTTVQVPEIVPRELHSRPVHIPLVQDNPEYGVVEDAQRAVSVRQELVIQVQGKEVSIQARGVGEDRFGVPREQVVH